jgi:hypothetical protein
VASPQSPPRRHGKGSTGGLWLSPPNANQHKDTDCRADRFMQVEPKRSWCTLGIPTMYQATPTSAKTLRAINQCSTIATLV